MGTLSNGTYSAVYKVDVFAVDTFTDEPNILHHHKDVILTIDHTSAEQILLNSIHIYSTNKEHTDAFKSLVA